MSNTKVFFLEATGKKSLPFSENGRVYFSNLKPSQIFEFNTIYPSFDMWIMQELRITLHEENKVVIHDTLSLGCVIVISITMAKVATMAKIANSHNAA